MTTVDALDVSRRGLLAGAAGASLLAMFGRAGAALTYDIKPAVVADGIWVIAGARETPTGANGGAIANIGIIDTPAGAVIVDTGPSKIYGEALRQMARDLTGKDVARVYVTHFHPDHVFGNQAFDRSLIAAPKGVIDGLTQLGETFATNMYATVGDWMRGTDVVMPGTPIASGIEDIGGRRLRLMELAGHTSSDLAIFDERTGVLFAGDLAFLDRAPTTPHADLAIWHKSLATLAASGHNQIVPGHGPVESGRRGIEQTRDWLSLVEETIRGGFDRGLDLTEALSLPLPLWTETIALARYEFQRSVMHIFPRLEAGNWPRVDIRN